MKATRVWQWVRVTGCTALVLACSAPGRTQPTDTPAAGVVQVKRPNLVVTDLDRSLRLYRDVLGFTVFGVGDSASDSYSYPVFGFPKQARLRMATLSTASELRVLALTELKGVPLPPAPRPHRHAVVIEVKGLESIVERVRGLGLTVVAPKPSSTPEGQTFVEQALEDFDGHLVVLYEIR
jgi:catechol 2,3-dioxygenase-like lactoylglutathione lyase family enzyme